jgi:ubiquinone/menaquinone biosynthesis C-methylase UbiE
MTDLSSHPVATYYGQKPLLKSIDAALRGMGKDPERVTTDELAPLDQFHIHGKVATLELAQLAKIRAEDRVLDIGGGLGGPARTLAKEFGCSITVLDLTEEFCLTGEVLTRRTGLSDHINFVHGNALDLPFPPESFDVVWTQHSSMNIPDKALLYRQAALVLKPGGTLAIHEVMAGPKPMQRFPVPWAATPDISHLVTPDETRRYVTAAGFRELEWRDQTEYSKEWLEGRMSAGPEKVAPVGAQLILGENFRPAYRNILSNLAEDTVRIIEAVFTKQ